MAREREEFSFLAVFFRVACRSRFLIPSLHTPRSFRSSHPRRHTLLAVLLRVLAVIWRRGPHLRVSAEASERSRLAKAYPIISLPSKQMLVSNASQEITAAHR